MRTAGHFRKQNDQLEERHFLGAEPKPSEGLDDAVNATGSVALEHVVVAPNSVFRKKCLNVRYIGK